MLTSEELKERMNQLSKTMSDPQLDDTWKLLDQAFKQRQKATREWFNNLLVFGIAATIIQVVVLVLCLWYFTK